MVGDRAGTRAPAGHPVGEARKTSPYTYLAVTVVAGLMVYFVTSKLEAWRRRRTAQEIPELELTILRRLAEAPLGRRDRDELWDELLKEGFFSGEIRAGLAELKRHGEMTVDLSPVKDMLEITAKGKASLLKGKRWY